ncbi:MAG TPA: tryptophan synthase subunit alpha [Micropepsaceae bacterium]|nr:tryptophan synthase subunit alpha [Micropepsaceae bacterium]
MSRIAARFAELRALNRAGFIPFITAGDPDSESSFEILQKLAGVGADLIELGMPFSDPMADGPAIQASSMRALKAGMTVKGTLHLVERFRARDSATPIVLMGYYNPIHAYGAEHFLRDAAHAGVDGLIIVDLGPEEDSTFRVAAAKLDIDTVRLATPTTDDKRLTTVLYGAGGFLYYVSVAGVTGTKTFASTDVSAAIARIRRASALPCAVGFGIKTPEQAAEIACLADAAVVGSAIVTRIEDALRHGKAHGDIVDDALNFCRRLADAVHKARDKTPPILTSDVLKTRP